MKNTKNAFLIIISLMAFLVFSAEIPVITIKQKDAAVEKTNKYLMNLAEKEALILSSSIVDAGGRGRTLAELRMHEKKQDETLYEDFMIKSCLADSMIYSIGYWMEPYYAGKEKKYEGMSVTATEDGTSVLKTDSEDGGTEYFSKDWFLKGIAVKEGFGYSGLVYDESADTYLLMISSRIVEDGSVTGITTVAISSQELGDYLTELTPGDEIQTLLITEDKLLLGEDRLILTEADTIHEESFLYEEPKLLDRIIQSADTGAQLQGKYLVAWALVGQTGMRFVVYYPKSELMAEITDSIVITVVIFLLAMLLFVVVLNVFLRRFVERPLKKILQRYKISEIEDKDHLKFSDAIQLINRLLAECSNSIDQLNVKNIELEEMKDEFEGLYQQTAAMNSTLNSLLSEIKEGYAVTVRSLSNAIEANDKHTIGHCERVANYAVQMAKKFDFSEKELQNIEYAAMLHDIGNIGVPVEILNKSGKLTEEEFTKIKKHPMVGYEIIKDIEFLKGSADLVLHHHEHVDGSGYPDGLCGDEIALAVKILTVADHYDAMTSSRPYREEPLPEEIAVDILCQKIGTWFDETVVTVFLQLLHENSCL